MLFPAVRNTFLVTFCLAFPAAQSASAQFQYYYYKTPVPLGVEASKMAVFSEHVDIAAALTVRGMKPQSVAPGPFENWSIAHLPPDLRDASQNIDNAAHAQSIDFVSPVFLDARGDPLIVTPWILVRFNDDIPAARAEKILAQEKIGTILTRDFAHLPGLFRLRASSKNGIDVLTAVNALAMRPDVQYAEPDSIRTGHTTMIPNDAGFSNCWGQQNTGQLGGQVDFDMDTTDAWDITIGSPSVIVMIMDVGVQQDHPDINQIPGFDYTGLGAPGGGPFNACDNHGTAVASCVSGIVNNGIGTVGSAPGCKTYSAKIGTSTMPCGTAFSSMDGMVATALGDAWNSVGARITNSSFTYGSSATLNTAYGAARTNGVINFAAAGNSGVGSISYPANLNNSVSAVAALNRFGARAGFSQFGSGLDFSAPGEDIFMADRTGTDGYDPSDYVTTFGTSFATPYTCGVAALMLSIKPNLTPSQIETILSMTCDDMGPAGYDTGHGWGKINAFSAVTFTQGVDADPPSPNPMTFSIDPHPASTTSIAMQAALASDSVSSVQYMFDHVTGFGGGTDSSWQASRDYTDGGLFPNSSYTYRVKSRDTSSPFMNETGFSGNVLTSSAIETPIEVLFGAVDDTSIAVQAGGTFTNPPPFGSTGFYFEMTPSGGSGANQWISATSTTITGLSPCTTYTFRVKARNVQAIETAYTASVPQSTTGCVCLTLGDINGDTLQNGDDIGGYVRVKLGMPLSGDNPLCADYGNNDLDLDTLEFVADLLDE